MFDHLHRRIVTRNPTDSRAVARQLGLGCTHYFRRLPIRRLPRTCVVSRPFRIGAIAGIGTPEWIRANVTDRDLTDTVCVSANGHYIKLADELNARWHAFEPVVEDPLADAEGSLLTASPEAVTKRARNVLDEFPQKRVVIHYVQPHTPYLGTLGREQFEPGRNLQDIGTDPAFDRDLINEAYHENLKLVLSSVEELLDTAGPDIGRIVVSSDHGELLGERLWPLPVRQWGHIPSFHHPILVQVPWQRFDIGERRDIVAEKPVSGPRMGMENEQERLTEHLQALGYAE